MKNNGPDDLSRRTILKKAGGLLINASLPPESIVGSVRGVLNLTDNVLKNECKKIAINRMQTYFSDTITNSTYFLLCNYQDKMYLPHAHYPNNHLDFEDLTDQEHLQTFAMQMEHATEYLQSLGILDIAQSELDKLNNLYRLQNQHDIDGEFRKEYMRIVFDSIPKIKFDIENTKKEFLVQTLTDWYMPDLGKKGGNSSTDQKSTHIYVIDEDGGNITAKICGGGKYVYEVTFATKEILTPHILKNLEQQVSVAKEKLGLMLKYSPEELLSHYNDSECSWDFDSLFTGSEGKFHEENLQYRGKGLFDLSSNQLSILEGIGLEKLEESEETHESWKSDDGEKLEEEQDNGEKLLLT